MKVAIVHDFLTKIGGAEKVLTSLHELYPDAPIYTLLYDKNGTKGIFSGSDYKIITSSLQKSVLRSKSRLLLPKYPQAIEEFNFSGFDVVISASNSFAHGIITNPKTLHICYCYSPMRYAWDWKDEYLIENKIGLGPIGLAIRKTIANLRIWDRLSADRVDNFIAISKTVQKRISKYYRRESDVIYPPVNVKNFSPTTQKGDFYLIVSRLTQYKKIDSAIFAFNELGKKLIIVGEGNDLKRLKSLSKNNIQFLGWQPDQSVARLMSEALALIFPGVEDFGLTPIEAMAAGTPVIGLNQAGVAETVIGGKTGVLFENPTEVDIFKAVKKFESTQSSFKQDELVDHASKYGQDRFTKEFKEIVNELFKKYQDGEN